jgi:hypothetical protein
MYVSNEYRRNPEGDRGIKHEHGFVFYYGDWTGNKKPPEAYSFYQTISAHEVSGWACINLNTVLT